MWLSGKYERDASLQQQNTNQEEEEEEEELVAREIFAVRGTPVVLKCQLGHLSNPLHSLANNDAFLGANPAVEGAASHLHNENPPANPLHYGGGGAGQPQEILTPPHRQEKNPALDYDYQEANNNEGANSNHNNQYYDFYYSDQSTTDRLFNSNNNNKRDVRSPRLRRSNFPLPSTSAPPTVSPSSSFLSSPHSFPSFGGPTTPSLSPSSGAPLPTPPVFSATTVTWLRNDVEEFMDRRHVITGMGHLNITRVGTTQHH